MTNLVRHKYKRQQDSSPELEYHFILDELLVTVYTTTSSLFPLPSNHPQIIYHTATTTTTTTTAPTPRSHQVDNSLPNTHSPTPFCLFYLSLQAQFHHSYHIIVYLITIRPSGLFLTISIHYSRLFLRLHSS